MTDGGDVPAPGSPTEGSGRSSRREERVDVIIVTWNGRHHLERCLPAVAEQTVGDMQVTVVDNGSTDGTLEWLAEAWPKVRTVTQGRNTGFAAANNAGIAASDAPWVALLNNDTMPDPGWLAALIETGERDPMIGSVASCMRFADRPGMINSAGIAVDPTGIAWDRLGGAPIDGGRAPAPVFGASAGAALYRRSALQDVAEPFGRKDGTVFDPRFFMYLEDVDLAWRLRLRGWSAAYAPDAGVAHAGSGTSGEGSAFKNRLLARNKIWTVVKNYPAAGLFRWWPLICAYDLASAPYRLVLSGQTSAIAGRLRALKGLAPTLEARRAIQRGRRIGWTELREAMSPLEGPLAVTRRYRHLVPRR